MRLLPGLAALALSSMVTLASAQTGTDTCTTPDAIAGQGLFAFDSSLATTGTEGQAEALCYYFAVSGIDSDVWFSWTADATGNVQIDSCASTVDTKMAVYPGAGCPTSGTAITCNDDTCGLQAVLGFAVTAGVTYTLQVGTYPGAGGGTGSLNISITSGTPPNDGCLTPAVVAGQGSFPFNNAAATAGAEGQNETVCYSFGTSGIDSDIWFTWTADATGIASMSTCNSTFDSKIAAYPGTGCPVPGTGLDCNDDACSLQSTIQFPVVNGTSYTLQVGTFPGKVGAAGTFDIAISGAPTDDDCSTPAVIAGQGVFGFDLTGATTGLEGQNEAICYDFGTSNFDNDVWFEWTANATGPALIATCNSGIDTRIAAYPGTGCPTPGSAIACNDDTCALQSEITFAVVAGTTYTLQVGNFPGALAGAGVLDISISGAVAPGTPFCFCDLGNSPCGNGGGAGSGCANGSSASGATLEGTGVAQVGNDSLVLLASGLAPGQPGLYFQGNNQVNGGAGILFGDGLRCAGGSVIRLGVASSNAAGESDTTGFATSISVKGVITVGDLRSYQLWYRDPLGSPCGSLFNLSNGYTIQW